jgi:hypothetical protein
MGQFSYSSDGYLSAKKWLKKIKEWSRISTSGFSTDGWSVIHEANSLWDKQNELKNSTINK